MRKTVTVSRPVDVPIYRLCSNYVRTVVAVQVLAHEAMHVRGIVNEAAAECYAMQVFASVAERLGVPTTRAREMASDYWRDVYPQRPPESAYRSSECRDGGALDLAPTSSSWPTP